jgi:hypothetical protein
MASAHAAVNGSESGAGPVPHPQLFRLAPPALLPLDLFLCRWLYDLLPPEQPLDIRQFQFDVGRAAVIALAGVGRRFHLAE